MDTQPSHSRAAPGRSCIACSRRKIRCSRGQPCTYCNKLRVQCAYPGSSQEKGRQSDSDDVRSRLKRIEASLLMLQSKAAQRSDHHSQPIDLSQSSRKPTESANGVADSPSDPGSGKLVHEHQGTRFVTNSFWTALEEDDKHNSSGNEQCAADPSIDPSSVHSSSVGEPHQGFMFGFSSTSTELHRFHPSQSRIFGLWQIYLDSIDPLLKILHVPVTQRQILRASQNLENIPPAFESLMFSIYYAAVTSVPSSVACENMLQEDRQTLLDRYRFGVEQSLARASFMANPNIPTLQALTLYLVCARQACDKTYVWTMTGLAIRLATKLGLQRDPIALGLPTFVAEMRRRLWWQIVILDVRTAEDNDMDPYICEHHFDTKFPACINDIDLDINMTQPVANSHTRTEMLFCLTRFEISYAARKLVFSSKFNHDNGYASMSSIEKNYFIDSLQESLTGKYLDKCDKDIPICFLTTTATRLILAKMKLTINHPTHTGSSGISQERFFDLVESSIEIIEYSHTLRTSERYARWVWLFQKYVEWDAVAFLLLSLTALQSYTLIDRAWEAVNCFFRDWEGYNLKGERRWKRLESLRSKAVSKFASKEANASSVASGGPAKESFAQLSHRSGQCDQGEDFQAPVTNVHETISGTPNYTLLGREAIHTTEWIASASQGNDPQSIEPYLDWDFDNVPYITQGAVSWEMDVDEDAFSSWL